LAQIIVKFRDKPKTPKDAHIYTLNRIRTEIKYAQRKHRDFTGPEVGEHGGREANVSRFKPFEPVEI